tara:strand:- start:84 stop:263 length:180 start_codon:yes stop_codon:yes gene_type:complete
MKEMDFNKITKHELLNMKIHQCYNCKHTLIKRVLGGWIYERQEPQVNIVSQVFIPFSTI